MLSKQIMGKFPLALRRAREASSILNEGPNTCGARPDDDVNRFVHYDEAELSESYSESPRKRCRDGLPRKSPLREIQERDFPLESTALGVVTVDFNGNIIDADRSFLAMVGYATNDLVFEKEGWNQINPVEYRQLDQWVITHLLATGSHALWEKEYVCKNGFRMSALVVHMQASSNSVAFHVLDITARKQAERQMREQADLLDHVNRAYIVMDLKDRIVLWNESAARLYGWTAEEAVGRNIRILLAEECLAQYDTVCQVLAESGEWSGELSQLTRCGSSIVVRSYWKLVREVSKPAFVVAVNTDITGSTDSETKFLVAQQLYSIGVRAAGAAHDIKSLLAAILLAIEPLRSRLQDDDARAFLALLKANAERGSALVNGLLNRSSLAERSHAVVDARHLVTDIIEVLDGTLTKSIKIKALLPDDLWDVVGDEVQLGQVLLNLCINARDAIAAGGTITIRVAGVTTDEDGRQRRFVRISVADTGIGIPQQDLKTIFEPFFTTKEAYSGTGLGLSSALEIVKQHGGWIEVCTNAGSGTEITVWLPAAEPRTFSSAQDVLVEYGVH